MKAFQQTIIATVLFIACLAFLTGCLLQDRAKGGTASYNSTEFNPDGSVKKKEQVQWSQQEDPKDGSGFTFGITQTGLTLEGWFGSSFFRVPPVKNTAVKMLVAGAGVIGIALGGFALYRTHVRLGTMAIIGGGMMIAVVLTIDKYGAYYAGGVALIVAALAWLAWSSYRSGQSPEPIPS